jgi:hypothetical protein
MGGGSDTQTTTSNVNQTSGTNYAPWIGQMQQGLGALGLGLTQNFLTDAPTSAVAGFTPDQNKGYDMLRGSALQYGQSSGTPTYADMMKGGTMNAAQLGANDYQRFMNPYIQSVIDPTLQNLQRQKANTAAEIGASDAAAGAYGGSRGALQRAQLDRSTGETAAQLIPSLLSSAYNSAQGLASQNVDRQQQANATNAGNALQAYGLQNTLQNSDLNRQLSAISALLGGGQQQQALAQKSLDVPFDKATWLASLIPGVYDATSYLNESSKGTKPDNSPSTGQSLLGLAGTLLGGKTSSGDKTGTVAGDLLGQLFK